MGHSFAVFGSLFLLILGTAQADDLQTEVEKRFFLSKVVGNWKANNKLYANFVKTPSGGIHNKNYRFEEFNPAHTSDVKYRGRDNKQNYVGYIVGAVATRSQVYSEGGTPKTITSKAYHMIQLKVSAAHPDLLEISFLKAVPQFCLGLLEGGDPFQCTPEYAPLEPTTVYDRCAPNEMCEPHGSVDV